MTFDDLKVLAATKGYMLGSFTQDMQPNLIAILHATEGSMIYSSTNLNAVINWLNDPGEF